MSRIRFLLLALFGLPLAIAGWLWFTMLSPFTYDRPEDLAPITTGPHEVFVYGTLRLGLVRFIVMGRAGESEAVVLEDFRRDGLDLTRAPGDQVAGEIVEVSAEELARLDRYERLGFRYERVRLEIAEGRDVWVYRRLPESQSQVAPQE